MSPRKKTPAAEVKKTGGGAFNPADRNIYFSAGESPVYPKYVLTAVNDLWTPGTEKHLVNLMDEGHVILLDSGVFWLTNRHKRAHGISMDEALSLPPEEIDGFDELNDRYLELVTRYADRLWGYIELDQGGVDNKRRTRARLESSGIIPIPVYHPLLDGWDYFDELAQGYDRICFGNIVQASPPVRLRLMHTLWERHRAYPDLWVHVLGLTANSWCLSVPPDSCDSSTWLAPLRWPAIITESALMKKVGTLLPGFSYDLSEPSHPERGRFVAANMCAESVTAINLVWRDSRNRANDVTGQPNFPPRMPEEAPLAPGI